MAGYHVHLGAGSIGLACVLPLLKNQERRILVVNRVGDRFDSEKEEHNAWREFQAKAHDGFGELLVRIRHPSSERNYDEPPDEGFLLFAPVAGKTSLSNDQLQECAQLLKRNDIYLLTNDIRQLEGFLKDADSISTALHNEGQKTFAEALKSMGQAICPKPVFLFENLNVFGESMGAEWRGAVHHVIVDRLCLQKASKFEDGRVVERVSCEPRIELLSEDVLTPAPSYWTRKDPREMKFYELRKRYLVNSVHTVIAMLGYQRLSKKRIENVEHSRQILSVVLDGVLGDPISRRVIEVFLAARVQQLLLEVGQEERPKEFSDDETAYLQLVGEGKEVIARMQRFPDEMGRVLRSEERRKIHERWFRHVEDLIQSVRSKEDDYLRFPSLARPHVKEIESAVRHVRNAARALVISD